MSAPDALEEQPDELDDLLLLLLQAAKPKTATQPNSAAKIVVRRMPQSTSPMAIRFTLGSS
jgi:hypothetical protein